MDVADIAAFLVAAQRQNTRMDVTMAVIKQQQSQDQALLDILGEGLMNGEALQAAAPEGMGLAVDVTV